MLTRSVSRTYATSLLVSAAVLAVLVAPAVVRGAEIYGRVTLPNGEAVTNKTILLNGKEVGKTDASGGYRLSLPPGQYTLTIAGKNVPVVVPPPGVKQDIKLQ